MLIDMNPSTYQCVGYVIGYVKVILWKFSDFNSRQLLASPVMVSGITFYRPACGTSDLGLMASAPLLLWWEFSFYLLS